MNATTSNRTTNELLRRRLLALPFDAYLNLLAILLREMGYQGVELAGRTDWKGHNRGGGHDLVAVAPGGFSARRLVVRAKQFDARSRVFQRHADELRGAAIRVGATEALLVTSGPVSRSIDHDALKFPLAPVRLIGGEHLLELLASHRVGVTASGAIDEALLTRLERESIGNRQSDCRGVGDELVLTVALKRAPRRTTRAKRGVRAKA